MYIHTVNGFKKKLIIQKEASQLGTFFTRITRIMTRNVFSAALKKKICKIF